MSITLGIPKTRNRGIELARGEYIAMLDSDDLAYRTRLEKQVAFLDRHRDFAVVGSWVTRMDEKGRSLKRVNVAYLTGRVAVADAVSPLP